ncbi:MAG TPA: hypothetical protein HA306_03850 [Methanosarcina sp.]|nr:hypothetical protein [Methanosarcina sp.]
MLKRRNIGKWLVLMIFVLVLSSGSASADDKQLPDYGPELFEEIKKNPQFIAARGTMPEIGEGEEEKREWINSLTCCSSFSDLPSKMDPYMQANGGPVVGYGPSGMGGYLYVEFDKNTPEKINVSLIDEIYQVIDEHCEQEGISDVPVVFMWGEVPIEDEEAVGNEATNKSPGFTSIMVILGVLSSLIVKRL